MKRVFVLLISLVLAYNGINCKAQSKAGNEDNKASLQIIATPELTGLAKKLADEYSRVNPGIKISLTEATAENLTTALSSKKGIGLIDGKNLGKADKEPIWKTILGRDIVVPVINEKNSLITEIYTQGISTERLGKYLTTRDPENWEALVNSRIGAPSHYYSLNDESLEREIKGFVNIPSVNKEGKRFGTPSEMLSAIQSDPDAIGFLRLTDLVDIKTQSLAAGIEFLPLDRNGNGTIDFSEAIYEDLNSFTRGVWIGKYPKGLISNIYTVSSEQPDNETASAFLIWAVTGGQSFLPGSGYSDLLTSERQNSLANITSSKFAAVPDMADGSIFRSALLAILAVVAVFGLAQLIIRLYRSIKYAEETIVPVAENALRQESMVVPAGLYFDKTHTWAFMDQEGIVTAGIDDFLQHVTGKITRLKLKSAGKKIKKGEHFLSIVQNGKQLDLYSPVSGTIVETNSSLENDASVINSSPYKKGWIYKIEPSNWTRENPLLFMADKQKEFIKREFTRLRDFLATNLKSDMGSYSQVVLQDGGEIRDGVLSSLGPEVWEDFQTNFIEPSRKVWFYEI
jgi:glycine cleavage system H lipoate-binding protein/ABC-type phosphate transport system substrate-binding protein